MSFLAIISGNFNPFPIPVKLYASYDVIVRPKVRVKFLLKFMLSITNKDYKKKNDVEKCTRSMTKK